MFVGLLKTIFFLITFYYIFKFIGRILLPLFISRRVNKMTNNQKRQSEFRNQKRRDEGKVTIQKGNKAKKITSSDLGEYVNYEEVKE